MAEEKDIIEEVTIEEPTSKVEPDDILVDDKTAKKGYVKFRVARAEEDAKKSLLKELGFNDIEEAKNAFLKQKELESEYNKLSDLMNTQKIAEVESKKASLLKRELEKEKVFDSEALCNYVDFKSLELDEAGNLKDVDKVVSALKEKKPNFFGVDVLKSDEHLSGEPSRTPGLREETDPLKAFGQYVDFLKQKQ